MTLNNFLAIAEYANENWKCNFSEREVVENAVMLFEDFNWSLEAGIVSESVKTLLKNLDDDVCEESLHYANMIRYELKREMNLWG